MTWFKRDELTTIAEPEHRRKYTVETVAVDDLDEREYLELAKRAGYERGAKVALSVLQQQQRAAAFRSWLSGNGITVYSAEAVHRYMGEITPSGYRWGWLRTSTASPLDSLWSDRDLHDAVYEQAIPIPVLITMAKIRDAWPDVYFQVTSIIRAPKLDPFLRVAVPEKNPTWFIIERWDEPSFRQVQP